MSDSKEMSFLDHLEELRWRLVRSAIAILVFSLGIWFYQEWIMDNIFLSMKKPEFISFRVLCRFFNICIEEIPLKMQSTTMAGQFSYALWMSIIGGFILAFPFIFYQIWSFVKPGLKFKEKKVVKGIVFYVSILFFIGILFGYFIVAPLCVQFFGTYQISKSVENIFTVSSYMSTIISTVFYSGILFLLPIVAYIFSKLGIITPNFLRKYRKHAIVAILIISAIITPPDLISQIIVSIPIILLYELSIFVTVFVEKKRVTTK
ncbi:MAG: twin-arginine translocase subunit TatC [Flavobacteriia bacterium]|nr:twin-arginine translocase subunit TatC [Flavobacteriia bacterium]